MNKRVSVILLILLNTLVLTGCSSKEDNRINVPKSANDYEGSHFEAAQTELEELGFTNITLEKNEDLVLGGITKDGAIEIIKISGDSDFSSDSKFEADSEVVITYGTFPVKDELEPIEEPPVETDVNITEENNEEFAAVLATTNTSDPIIIDFEKKYSGKVLEFDGHIAHIAPHKDYNTRFDILIYVGDYRTENLNGPYFRFKNVAGTTISKEGLAIDSNVRVIGSSSSFDESRSIYELGFESISLR